MDKKKIGIGIVVLIVIIGIAVALTGNGEEELEPAEFEVSNLSVSEAEVNPRDTISVSVEVSNNGGETSSHTVELLINGESVDSKEVEVSGGQTETVTFQVSREDVGEYDVEISGLSKSFEVLEEVAPPEFEVSNLSVSPSEVEAGESITLTVDVTNTGGETGEKTLEFDINGTTEVKKVTVEPGETVSPQETITIDEAGSYQVNVEGLTGDFEALEPAVAEFEMSDLNINPQEVSPEETVSISVDVKNIGNETGTKSIDFYYKGQVKTEEVTLEPGETETVSVSLSFEEPDTYDITVDDLSDTLEVTTPEISVEYSVVVEFGSAYLEVKVSGPEQGYEILLFDPDGESVGTAYISSDDMIPGHETVTASMTDIGDDNPIPGEYLLIVKDSWTDERYYEANPTYEGPEVDIVEAEFVTDYDDYFEEGSIDEIILTVNNIGDLPIFAGELKIEVGPEESQESLYGEEILHGEETEISVSPWIRELEEGVHPVTLELYSEEEKIASYTTEVEIG